MKFTYICDTIETGKMSESLDGGKNVGVKKKNIWDIILFAGAFFVILCLEDRNMGITLHMATYFAVTFLCLRASLKPTVKTTQKIVAFLLYTVLLLCQLGYLYWMDFTLEDRRVACLLLFTSFLVDYVLKGKKDRFCVAPVLTDSMLSFEDLRFIKQHLDYKKSVVKRVGGVLTPTSCYDMLQELPRNCSIRYVNKDSLSETYLKNLEDSLSDPYVYFILSDTGSVASDFIGILTNKPYNHSSISFDPALKTLVSYNGGEKLSPPGLNSEMIDWFYKKEDASIRVYRLEVTLEQKRGMIERVRKINQEGSAYNVVGMALGKSLQPNMMVCSEFIYSLLKSVGAEYFQKPPLDIKPTDFVELDYERKLAYVETIQLSQCCGEMMEKGKPIPMESQADVLELILSRLAEAEKESENTKIPS